MAWMVVALATVLLGCTVLLAIPATLSVRVERTDRVRATWHVRWLLGLVEVRSGKRKPRQKRMPAS
jgi:hypothetical protein